MKLLLLGLALLTAATASAGQWSKQHYASPEGARDYFFYTPSSIKRDPTALLVVLHGCTEDPDSFAKDTGFNELAEKYSFYTLFPQQTNQDNQMKCWNWYLPQGEARDTGELAIVAGMVREAKSKHSIAPDKIFVAGLSAGAALAANLAACYSDLFSGAAVHSGLEYLSATNQQEALQAMQKGSATDLSKTAAAAVHCVGSGGRPIRLVSIQGDKDYTVNAVNAKRVIEQFTKINDWLDDGKANGSHNLTPLRSTKGQVPGGHPYTVTTYGDGKNSWIEEIVVNDMGHAWSGSAQAAPYADPKGPPVSQMIWDFFTN